MICQQQREKLQRLGINLGAPGARRGPEGTIWVEYPSVAGEDAQGAPIELTGAHLEYHRRHSSSASGDLAWVAASGVQGIESLVIPAPGAAGDAPRYQLTLLFAEPDKCGAGDRVFDVVVQDRLALPQVDVAKEMGGARVAMVRRVDGVVPVDGKITLRFLSNRDAEAPPVLSGIAWRIE